MKKLLPFLLLLVSTVVSAQTGAKLQWDMPETPVAAQGNSYTLKVDTGTPTALAATCVALSGVPGLLSRCTAPLQALAAGPHTLVLTASNGLGSTSSDPLTGAPPGKPSNLITIVITIQ